MKLRTLADADVRGKRVIHRVAYDITLAEKDGAWVVPDDTRIRATLPTIQFLLEQGCAIVLMTWLKRPAGQVIEKYRLDPVAKRLSELLGKPVKKVNDCVGPEAVAASGALKPGEILMLENTRFHPEEEAADTAFARELARHGDCVVYDAFAQAHRVHASTTGILEVLPSAAGLLMEKEVTTLSKIMNEPERPYAALLGGVKISDKVSVIKSLMRTCDIILIGGALANTFLLAQGKNIGASVAESQNVDKGAGKVIKPLEVARELYEAAEEVRSFQVSAGLRKIQLPVDFLAARELTEGAPTEVFEVDRLVELSASWSLFDIGPATVKLYSEILSQAKTVLWNGPMGTFETKGFEKGTEDLARAIASRTSSATTVTGGGDTETAISAFQLNGKFTHSSTGGGASLKFLSGKELPVLKFLMQNF